MYILKFCDLLDWVRAMMDFYCLAYTQELQNFLFCCLYFCVYVCTLFLCVYILKLSYLFIDIVGSGGCTNGFYSLAHTQELQNIIFCCLCFLCMHAPNACVSRFSTSINMQGKEIYIHICILDDVFYEHGSYVRMQKAH